MNSLLINRFIFLFLSVSLQSFAQSGGPPMLTHGTGTPGNKNWEINTSFNTEFSEQSVFTVPLLDFNYGVKEQTQLKFEIPYLITKTENKNFSSGIGDAIVGVKHRLVNEEAHFISFSVYPQIEFSFSKGGHTQYKLLIQFKKTIGRLVVCQELGYIYVQQNPNFFMSGTLVGFKVSSQFEIMCELFFEKIIPMNNPDGLFNFGVRYELNKRFILLASAGTQFIAEENTERKTFFSFIGLQWLIEKH